MYRTIVVDVRSTAVMGFHAGWEAASSSTSLQAILCAAEDKKCLAARFGIDINVDDWPGMLHRLYLADNGEVKSEALQEAERHFHFGLEFAKAYSGQSKSVVESQHHTDHKALDHKLPGTTRGRKQKRGESHAADAALWNYFEYMHEYILAVLEHNNEEVPLLAPFEMRKEGVAPTRINIFRWMRDQGMRADIPCDLSQLRAFTLPDVRAVMRRDGIHLLMDDGIRILPSHRFFSGELMGLSSWRRAAERGRAVNLSVKLNSQDLSHVWLPTDIGLLRIPNVQAEQAVLEGMTLTDSKIDVHDQDIRSDSGRETRDQQDLDTIVRRLATTKNAMNEKRNETGKSSKASAAANRRKQSLNKNKVEELGLISPAPSLASPKTSSAPASTLPRVTDDAADRAMSDFMKGLDK